MSRIVCNPLRGLAFQVFLLPEEPALRMPKGYAPLFLHTKRYTTQNLGELDKPVSMWYDNNVYLQVVLVATCSP